jgi:hypothetical protein
MTTLTGGQTAATESFALESDGFSFDFPGMTAGQDYTVKLWLAEVKTRQHRDTLLSIHANGELMLRHGAIVTSANAADGSARVSFVSTADESGQITLAFSGFTESQILGIEILTGKHLPPAEPEGLCAYVGGQGTQLSWTPVPGALSYIVKRKPTTGPGHATVVAAGLTEPQFADAAVERDETYQYIVIAVNGMGESGPSRPATALPPFRISVTPQTVQVSPTRAASCAVVATVLGGVDGALVLSVSGMTSGVSAWFDKAKLGIPAHDGQEQQVIDRLNVTADKTSRPGRYELRVQASLDGYTNSVLVAIEID